MVRLEDRSGPGESGRRIVQRCQGEIGLCQLVAGHRDCGVVIVANGFELWRLGDGTLLGSRSADATATHRVTLSQPEPAWLEGIVWQGHDACAVLAAQGVRRELTSCHPVAGHGLGVGTGKQARRPALAALHGAVRCSGKPAVDCAQQFGTIGDDASPAPGEALAAGLQRPGYVAQAVTRFAVYRVAKSCEL